MVSLDIGTLCVKVSGREAGNPCVVIKSIDKTFVMITGPKLLTSVKRRRCNMEHLEPTGIKLDIKEDAADEEIIEAYKKANVITKFNLKLPSAGEMKAKKEKVKKKEEPKEKVKEDATDDKKLRKNSIQF